MKKALLISLALVTLLAAAAQKTDKKLMQALRERIRVLDPALAYARMGWAAVKRLENGDVRSKKW